MTKTEIATFIETMGEFGDIWTEDQVTDVYGNVTLEEALTDRKGSIDMMGNIIETVLNN